MFGSQHTVHTVLQERDEIVYYSLIQATPGDKDKNEAGGGEFTDYPTDSGVYTLYAKADNQPNDTWTQATIYEWGWPCIGLSIYLGRHGSDRHEDVAIWSPNDCTAEVTEG